MQAKRHWPWPPTPLFPWKLQSEDKWGYCVRSFCCVGLEVSLVGVQAICSHNCNCRKQREMQANTVSRVTPPHASLSTAAVWSLWMSDSRTWVLDSCWALREVEVHRLLCLMGPWSTWSCNHTVVQHIHSNHQNVCVHVWEYLRICLCTHTWFVCTCVRV